MKQVIFTIAFCLSLTISLPAQVTFQSHRVVQGETLFGISKQYDVSERDILTLNPEVKDGLKENAVLIIPVKLPEATVENSRFREHKVKRKETLFALSQRYGVSVDNIKKHNPHLYADESLKQGEVLKIATGAVVIAANPVASKPVKPKAEQHLVEAKETKYGIAKQYGLTVAELERQNPVIADTDNLPVGLILNVRPATQPEQSAEETLPVGFVEHRVQPKEGFYRLKVLYGISEAAVIQYNPEAKDGLKEGMLLRIPTAGTPLPDTETTVAVETTDLEAYIRNRNTRKVVLLLPFDLQKVQKDSVRTIEEHIQGSAVLRVALDFYSGALLALESAKEKGLSTELYVFDSREVGSQAADFLKRKNLDDADVVIGPLRQAAVEKVAAQLTNLGIPVISPLSNRQGKATPNYIHSIPSDALLQQALLGYLTAHKEGKKLILITDATKSAQRNRLQSFFPGIQLITPRDGSYFRTQDIAAQIDAGRENWVLLESTNATMVNSAIGVLNSLNKKGNIRLFTTDHNDAFNYSNISNMHLAKLRFTFASVSKSNTRDARPFLQDYRKEYGTYPNRFAIRGYDLVYDTLLRLAYGDGFLDAMAQIDAPTEYVQNKFHYHKNPQGGYHNTATYIVQYNEDLELEEVTE